MRWATRVSSPGMVLGGVLVWVADWRWTLLVNVPVGLLIAVLGSRVLGASEPPVHRRALDLPGALLSVVGMTAVVYGFVRVADAGWRDAVALAALAAGVLVLAVFALLESRTATPLLPLRVFAHRARAGSFVNLVLLAFVLTGFLFFATQFLQRTLHLNPLATGLAFLPFGLSLLGAARSSAKLMARVGPRVAGVAGLVLILAGALWLTRVGEDGGYLTAMLGPMLLLGAGAGTAIVPFNVVILSETPAADAGITSGVLQASLSVGGSLGLAVLLTLFAGGNSVADGVSRAFAGSAAAAGIALVVAVLTWFLPSRKSSAE